jgi:hypothetical protein
MQQQQQQQLRKKENNKQLQYQHRCSNNNRSPSKQSEIFCLPDSFSSSSLATNYYQQLHLPLYNKTTTTSSSLDSISIIIGHPIIIRGYEKCENTTTSSTKQKNVMAFYDLMFNQKLNPAEAIDKYVGEVYIQHNPAVAYGKGAFIEILREWQTSILASVFLQADDSRRSTISHPSWHIK